MTSPSRLEKYRDPAYHGPQDVVHRTGRLFHGVPVDEAPYKREGPACFGDEISMPLHLIRNGRFVPAVFEPRVSLVVSENVQKSLSDIQNVALIPVVFQKIVDFPFVQPGDFAYEKDPQFLKVNCGGTVEKFLNNLPDVPKFHDEIGNYFELIAPRLSDLLPKYNDLQRFVCRMPLSYQRKEELLLSSKMLEEFPIVWWTYYVFSESAFGKISRDIDRRFFSVVEISL